jgi:FtsH-binding integral membrane protein
MKYYGLLVLVLVCLIASVFVEGQHLFESALFSVAYVTMAAVLVIGSKHEESFRADFVLGWLLICAVGFMSTQVLIEMLTNNFTEPQIFKVAIIVALDYGALSFLGLGMKIRRTNRMIGEGRYAIG